MLMGEKECLCLISAKGLACLVVSTVADHRYGTASFLTNSHPQAMGMWVRGGFCWGGRVPGLGMRGPRA